MAIDRITTGAVLDGAIATADIADNAVTTAKITDANITTAKVADDAITGAKIENNPTIAGNAIVSGTLGVTGETTLATHLNMGDGDQIKLGASADLVIGHTGSHSDVKETGTGDLRIWGNDIKYYNSLGSKFHAQMVSDGAVSLYYNGNIKLATTTSGVSVTGATTISGNLGIGATTIDSDIHIEKSSDIEIKLERTGSGTSTIGVPSSGQLLINNTSNADMVFSTNNTERFRVKNSGNFLVGTTNQSPAESHLTQGIRLGSNGTSQFSSSGDAALQSNRNGSDGMCMRFYRGGSQEGEISVVGNSGAGAVFIGHDNTGLIINDTGVQRVAPSNNTGGTIDNATTLGWSNRRFTQLFATSSSINTSDENEKQDIEKLSDAEKKVAVVAKSLIKKYRWKDAVTKKGDDARIHIGLIAQDLEDAFKAEGLDASRYGMFCSDTWWEKEEEYTDDDGKEQTRVMDYVTEESAPEGATKKTRLGVRYSELLAFIISAM